MHTEMKLNIQIHLDWEFELLGEKAYGNRGL